MGDPAVQNLSVAGQSLEERRVTAMEGQATALRAAAAAQVAQAASAAAAAATMGASGNPAKDRFTLMVQACVHGRVAADVEGFLKFAQELCDGIDRQFPAVSSQPATPVVI